MTLFTYLVVGFYTYARFVKMIDRVEPQIEAYDEITSKLVLDDIEISYLLIQNNKGPI